MVLTRTGLSPVMVGRRQELDRLRQLVGQSRHPRVALIRGEAGVGKTRLIKELTDGLTGDVVLLAAEAEQGAMGRPYQLLLEAVGPMVDAWSRVVPPLRRWEDALACLLTPVAPSLVAADRRYDSDELARAALELVRYLVGHGSGVIVFEDLHWADPESLGLFQRLAVAPDLPVLLVGTYRPEDLDRGHVTDLLAAIERRRDVAHVTLDRLSVDEVRTLIAAARETDVPYATAAELHRRTGGNPFFVEELLVAAGDASSEQLAELPLPETLTEAVLRHLEALSPEQRHVIDAAAVLGQRIPFDMLGSVTGIGEGELIDVLRDLVGRGLIIEDDADVFSFRHALTREAVAGRLLARERRRLHEKCLAALLEAGSDDWSALAHHAGGAGRWEEMVSFARTGASLYLRTGATYQALRLAELALREADADVELLEAATRAAWSVGLPAEALERVEQWRQLAADSGDPALLSRALRVLARLRWEAGDTAGHEAAVAAAREVGEQLAPGAERGWVANLLAESAYLAERPEDAISWSDEALEMAEAEASRDLLAAILVNRGSALIVISGREAEGEQTLVEGINEAVAVGDHLSALRGINNLAHHVFPVWAPARSEALLAQMASLIERSGRQDWVGSHAHLKTTYLAFVQGDLVAARDALTDQTGHATKWAWTILTRAELAFEMGDDKAAEHYLGLAATSGGELGDIEQRLHASALRTGLAARRGDAAAALTQLDAIEAELPALGRRRCLELYDAWHSALLSAVRAGAPPADVRARRERAGIATPNGRGDPAWPVHLDAALAEAEGDLDLAVGAYERATAPAGWRRSPAAAADAHLGAARCLLGLRRRDEATAHALAAQSLLERWPGPRRDEATAFLERLTREHNGVLTAREMDVARLLGHGLSNGEIASRLHISTKTASVHVSNILRKLDMASRAEVAAWAVREGLSD
jgi:DNA-binding CsgD family transcriptional regulator